MVHINFSTGVPPSQLKEEEDEENEPSTLLLSYWLFPLLSPCWFGTTVLLGIVRFQNLQPALPLVWIDEAEAATAVCLPALCEEVPS